MNLLKLICHGVPSRCFKFNNKYMLICARCLGFYTALIFGLLLSLFFKIANKLGKNNIMLLIIIFVAPLAIDGTTQLFKLRETDNNLRLITGLMAGFVCRIGIHYILIKNIL